MKIRLRAHMNVYEVSCHPHSQLSKHAFLSANRGGALYKFCVSSHLKSHAHHDVSPFNLLMFRVPHVSTCLPNARHPLSLHRSNKSPSKQFAVYTRTSTYNLAPSKIARTVSSRMCLIGLEHIVRRITCSISRLARAMWDYAIRFTFGTRAVQPDEEAAQPLLEQLHTTNTMEKRLPPLPQASSEDDRDALDLVDRDATDHNSIVLPSLSNPSTNIMGTNTSPRTEELQNGLNDIFNKATTRRAKRRFSPGSSSVDSAEDEIEWNGMGEEAEKMEHVEHTPPVELPQQPPTDMSPPLTLSHQDEIAMERIFTPVRGQLQRLKELTPESLPAYHPNMKAKSHAQVLKARLAHIGAHIAIYLNTKVPEKARGVWELKLCLFIATKYWPLPLTPTTHMDFLRINRNTRFRAKAREEVEAEGASHREWVEEVAQLKKLSFGEVAARKAGNAKNAPGVVDLGSPSESDEDMEIDDSQAPQNDGACDPPPANEMSDKDIARQMEFDEMEADFSHGFLESDAEFAQKLQLQFEEDDRQAALRLRDADDQMPDLITLYERPNTPVNSIFPHNNFDNTDNDDDDVPPLISDTATSSAWQAIDTASPPQSAHDWAASHDTQIEPEQQVQADEILALRVQAAMNQAEMDDHDATFDIPVIRNGEMLDEDWFEDEEGNVEEGYYEDEDDDVNADADEGRVERPGSMAEEARLRGDGEMGREDGDGDGDGSD